MEPLDPMEVQVKSTKTYFWKFNTKMNNIAESLRLKKQYSEILMLRPKQTEASGSSVKKQMNNKQID